MPDDNLSPELEMALILLKKAGQDLTAVKKWLADVDISDEIIGFHVQQAIEKSLKAILLRQRVEYPRTHNLRFLIDLCENNNVQVPPEFLQVDIFNRFAVQWRYDLLSPTSQTTLDRDDAYSLAAGVWNWAKRQVNKSL